MKRLLLLLIISTSFLASAQVPTYVPTDGLVAWYPMNPNTNEWDSSHTPVVDNTVAATDRFGNAGAIGFNGGGLIMGGLLTQVSSTFTYSIWVKNSNNIALPSSANFQNLGNDNHGAIHPIHGAVFGPHASNAGTGLCVGANGLYLQEHSHGYQRFAGWASHDFTEWSLVTVVYSNNEPTIYINGTAVATFPAGARTVYPSLGQDTNGYANYTTMGIGQMYNEGTFAGQVDEYGIWNRALTATEVQALYLSAPPQLGCTDASACNYDTEANVDDGSCIPSGCMQEGACNYNASAQCEGEACDYSCCPGPGCCVNPALWDAILQQCTEPEPACGAGTHWDPVTETCIADVPGTTDENCTVMNLQELAEGYQVLLDHTADQDSIILALSAELDTCDGTIPVPAGNSADGPCLGQDFVTYQGHDYGIIEIGNQCWLSENLNVTEFRDGTPIQHLQGTTEWLTTDAAGWCYPEDTQGNALAELGRLYNFWVVGNNICPSGWRIPSFAEWFQNDNLKPWFEAQAPEYAGMTGAALKVPGTESWNAPNAWANNQLGFNGLPTGSRNLDGEFSEPGSIATYHINNTFGGGEAHHTVLSSSSTDLYRISPWRGDTPETWHMGTAIRCIKN